MPEDRCAAGVGCPEVVDRLHAADTARALGYVDEAHQLQAAAGRWAEAHGHGGAVEPGESAAS